ncbi:hypothetical protein L914_07099 [Phytophthora nicotianae]|uniref:Uncharacterized protein n=2 Tax=Phytophthora nicotianae TaxID=4792 RepID=V9FC16_PHYNI|nr:hypothetical protein F443_07329 [Phytophthora nicotianae P1569]ETM48348.1 hypothetical protein L914_07099 [Phytophthora nicotianae]
MEYVSRAAMQSRSRVTPLQEQSLGPSQLGLERFLPLSLATERLELVWLDALRLAYRLLRDWSTPTLSSNASRFVEVFIRSFAWPTERCYDFVGAFSELSE